MEKEDSQEDDMADLDEATVIADEEAIREEEDPMVGTALPMSYPQVAPLEDVLSPVPSPTAVVEEIAEVHTR